MTTPSDKPASAPTIALYTCYHKENYRISSDIVFPIQVGAARAAEKLHMLHDSDGENISEKNPFFCELTAVYWIWKNSAADIVGLFHYRRFLNMRTQLRKALIPNEHFLEKHNITRKRVQSVLERFDVIVPCYVAGNGQSIREQYAEGHTGSDLELCLELIAEKWPEMQETANEVVNDRRSLGYFANILICRKPLFDEYAAWLFEILFEVEKRIHADVLTREPYQQRVYGFLSERLLTIFLAHKVKSAGLRVCEFPVLFATDSKRKYRQYRFRHAKQRALMKLGFRKESWQACITSTI